MPTAVPAGLPLVRRHEARLGRELPLGIPGRLLRRIDRLAVREIELLRKVRGRAWEGIRPAAGRMKV